MEVLCYAVRVVVLPSSAAVVCAMQCVPCSPAAQRSVLPSAGEAAGSPSRPLCISLQSAFGHFDCVLFNPLEDDYESEACKMSGSEAGLSPRTRVFLAEPFSRFKMFPAPETHLICFL